MKSLLQFLLRFLSKAYIRRYAPLIVGVTGNVGKTSTKEAIASVLAAKKRIRVSGGNLNNEFGLPLTILGNWTQEYYSKGGTLFFWAKVISYGFIGLFFQKKYPEILILEYGADHPGDIQKLVGDYKPHVGVVTAIGEIPVHVEYFKSPQELAQEKSQLIRNLDKTDFAVLNSDDPAVIKMKDVTKAKVITFGFGEADFNIANFDFRSDLEEKPVGVTFKLSHGQGFMPVRLDGLLGRSQAYAACAAVAVGSVFDINLVDASEALKNYRGSNGRLKIIHGIKDSTIIDDTYNASPSSVEMALETLKALPAKRKVAILGDMLELGIYSSGVHQKIGSLAAETVDVLICIGERAKDIAETAKGKMDSRNVKIVNHDFYFPGLVQEGDLILVKGSQGIRMEKVVEKLMANPDKKSELLVRQSKKWQDR